MRFLSLIRGAFTNHGTTEYRGIFPRYLPWRKISGTAQHYLIVFVFVDMHIDGVLLWFVHTVSGCGCRSSRRSDRNTITVWTAAGSEGCQAVGIWRAASTQCVIVLQFSYVILYSHYLALARSSNDTVPDQSNGLILHSFCWQEWQIYLLCGTLWRAFQTNIDNCFVFIIFLRYPAIQYEL